MRQRTSLHSGSAAPRGITRREILRAGLTGFTSLTLPALYQLRHAAAYGEQSAKDTAVILVWLRGGASHLDTFDPKPDAPSAFRGPFDPIDTVTPGMQISELLPQLSKVADRFSLLRSVAHGSGGHPAGSLTVLGGDPATADKTGPIYPDWMSLVSYLRRRPGQAIPNYVAVNPVDRYDSFQIAGPAYLGPGYEPFKVTGNPNDPNFEVPNIVLQPSQQQQIEQRVELRSKLDRLRSELDASGLMNALDQYESQAIHLLTSPAARTAFDLSREPEKVRDRYGRNQWGQQCLMARRLVEAGVDIVATEFDGPLCGRVANWDDHAVNHHVFQANQFRAPFFDQAISALIEDLYARGLDKRVLLVVTGEFGRTPRISYVASSGGGVASGAQGTVQPGRDHWPRANTMLFAGGGIRTGQVIGATDRVGEDPIQRRVGPGDFLATVYHHLGIDYNTLAFTRFAGRSIPLPLRGEPITELQGTA